MVLPSSLSPYLSQPILSTALFCRVTTEDNTEVARAYSDFARARDEYVKVYCRGFQDSEPIQ